jgi:hypothetical protein
MAVVVVVVYHLRENEASRHALWNGFPAARGGGDKEVYINNVLSNNHKDTNEITSNFRCGPLACSLGFAFLPVRRALVQIRCLAARLYSRHKCALVTGKKAKKQISAYL